MVKYFLMHKDHVCGTMTYDEVKLSNFALYHEGKLPYHNATSYDPNASLGGQMEKYWDLGQDVPMRGKSHIQERVYWNGK